jgi:3-dehydroquinate dehydratase
MENIDNLTKEELVSLQTTINNRLKQIEKDRADRANSSNKIKLSQLTNKDRILGIRFAWDGDKNKGKEYKYLKVLNAKWAVDFIDYCDVEYTPKGKDGKFNRIGFHHKTVPFGISASISDEAADKSYYLNLDTSSTGYDGFYTLSPKTWQVDIQTALKDLLKQRKYYQDIETKKLKEKVKLVLRSEEKINDFIK